MIITIDGPAASGKSTCAQRLAQELGFFYLNSGFLYRALAYLLLEQSGYTLAELKEASIADLEKTIALIQYVYDAAHGVQLYALGRDITPFLKTPTIDTASSIIAQHREARQLLTDLQRVYAQDRNVVAEGRDAAHVVFPHADRQFFLTASLPERARRWHANQKGPALLSLEEATALIAERDTRDMPQTQRGTRAIIVDGTHLSVDELVMGLKKLL